jgi:hypothetical protein
VAAIEVCCLGFIFVGTGHWSPVSLYELVPQSGPVYCWMIVAAVTLLRITPKGDAVGAAISS